MFPHLGRESASVRHQASELGFGPFGPCTYSVLRPCEATKQHCKVVVNFMHYFLLYCRLHKMDPRRTRRKLPGAPVNHNWQCRIFKLMCSSDT